MYAGLPDRALDFGRPFQKFSDKRVVGPERLVKFLGFDPGLLQRDLRDIRHQCGELVRFRKRVAHDASHVLDRQLGRQLVERHDVRDMVAAVFGCHVVNHPFASGIVEIHVDVGHRDAVGVQEAFEEEIVLERIDVGDAERVRDRRTGCRAAPGSGKRASVAHILDAVADDQEIRREIKARI